MRTYRPKGTIQAEQKDHDFTINEQKFKAGDYLVNDRP